jgi:hypothetical protein
MSTEVTGEEWVFTADQLKHHTASREDTLSEKLEEQYRVKACGLIKNVGSDRLKM